ncbi:MAG: hypothetical protein WA990_13575 [Rubrobacteraceae bacterium]
MNIAIVSLMVLAVVAFIAIPILATALGQASKRNSNPPGGEKPDEGRQETRSGPRGR